MIFVNP